MIVEQYGKGTFLTRESHWHECVGGRALCSDGKLRSIQHVSAPDTFFSIPCSVQVKGKTVRGFVSIRHDLDGQAEPFIQFSAVRYGKNGGLLP